MHLRAYGTAVLVVAAALWTCGDTRREHPVLSERAEELVRAAEARVAAHPSDAKETRGLAQQYLDAHQPGLALVLVGGAPASVRADVRVKHVYARALIDEGRNSDALEAEERVIAACRVVAEERLAPAECDPVLLASAMRRTDILRELLALGVEDARAHPEASLVAYQNATREARVAIE